MTSPPRAAAAPLAAVAGAAYEPDGRRRRGAPASRQGRQRRRTARVCGPGVTCPGGRRWRPASRRARTPPTPTAGARPTRRQSRRRSRSCSGSGPRSPTTTSFRSTGSARPCRRRATSRSCCAARSRCVPPVRLASCSAQLFLTPASLLRSSSPPTRLAGVDRHALHHHLQDREDARPGLVLRAGDRVRPCLASPRAPCRRGSER